MKSVKRTSKPKARGLRLVSEEYFGAIPAEKLPTKPNKKSTGRGSGIRSFDRTLHKTNIWIREVLTDMEWTSRDKGYSALRACLHALRDVLSVEEVAQFGAQLPCLLRGVYYEGWRPGRKAVRIKSIFDFHGLVFFHLGHGQKKFSLEDVQNMTAACFNVITKHVSAGEMSDIQAALPKRLQNLIPTVMEWPRHKKPAA